MTMNVELVNELPAEIDGAKKRLTKVAAHTPTIANTTTYWCLTKILQDLYDSGAAQQPNRHAPFHYLRLSALRLSIPI